MYFTACSILLWSLPIVSIPAQSADVGDVGVLTFMSLSNGDRECTEIAILDDSVLEGPETLILTLMPNTIIITVVDTVEVTIADEGKYFIKHTLI